MSDREDVWKINDEFAEKGYTDGLPIIPPTEERVKKMLEWTDRKPDDVLGKVPPSEYEATVEAVAVNAVMAGCKPEYFPVIVTEIIAMLDRPNLRGACATTGGVWPFAIVNGPIAKEIGLYGSWGVLGTGPFHRANLTIGRTMTLVSQNVGKSVPGISEKKPIYNMGRFGLCVAENEDGIPPSWEPLNVEKGFKKGTSTVAVLDEINLGASGSITGPGGRPSGIFDLDIRLGAERWSEGAHYGFAFDAVTLYIVSPGRAKVFADNGWSKRDIANFIYENCRTDPRTWYPEYPEQTRTDIMNTALASLPTWKRQGISLPIFERPENIWTVVLGGEPPREILIGPPGHSDHPAVIKQIALADGTPAKSVKDFKK